MKFNIQHYLLVNLIYVFFTETYLDKDSGTSILLESLVSQGKQLFLITNSGFPFV